jgi:hypothetical protein
MSALIASDTLATTAARSVGVIFGHGPLSKAARAAATARSTSALDDAGTLPTTSSVAGFTTSIVSVPAGVTQSPPMNSRS